MFQDTMVNMRWPDIQAGVRKNALVLLPVGVIEEHGPQLCLGTDIYTAHIHCTFIKQRLEKAGLNVMIAPPFYWGICQSTGGFTGSFRV
jgi:creatinine amidohydrolase